MSQRGGPHETPARIAIRHAALSDPGLHHQRNEDRWFADPRSGLYFVTDGMANEATPQFVLETLPGLIAEIFLDVKEVTTALVGVRLRDVIRDLNHQAWSRRLEMRGGNGNFGATLVAALVRSGQALLANLGDSRIYLHRNGILEQLSRDQSVVQKMLDAGQLTPDEAAVARSRSGPTSFIGMPGDANPEILLLPLQARDRLLLCSDGLTEMLGDDDVLAILEKSPSGDRSCQHLVDAANIAGGHDNITVLLIGAEDADNAL